MAQVFDFNAFLNQVPKFDSAKFDPSALFAAQQRNVEAMLKVCEVAVQTSQSLFRLQAELVNINLQIVSEYAKSVSEVRDLNTAFTKQADFLRGFGDRAASQSQQFAELATAGGSKALAIVQQRAEEVAAKTQAAVTKAL